MCITLIDNHNYDFKQGIASAGDSTVVKKKLISFVLGEERSRKGQGL